IVDSKTLAGGAFIHAECRRAERTRQQPSPHQLQSARLELWYPQFVVETFRQPLHQMRPLAAGNLDRMTHLDNVDPVGIERLRGERVEAAWRRRRCPMCHPADDAAGEKRRDHPPGANCPPRTPPPAPPAHV